MEIRCAITKTNSMSVEASRYALLRMLNACASTSIPYEIVSDTGITLTIKLVGNINGINQFRTNFVQYNYDGQFKWKDL